MKCCPVINAFDRVFILRYSEGFATQSDFVEWVAFHFPKSPILPKLQSLDEASWRSLRILLYVGRSVA